MDGWMILLLMQLLNNGIFYPKDLTYILSYNPIFQAVILQKLGEKILISSWRISLKIRKEPWETVLGRVGRRNHEEQFW